MKLDAEDRRLRMLHAHDLALQRPGSDLQAGRQGAFLRGQGMIPGHRCLLRHAPVQRAVRIEPGHGLLAVHQAGGVGHLAAVGQADRLVPEADAQGRDLPADRGRRLHDDPRVLRPPRPGRQDDVIRPELPDFLHGHRVVADHPDVRVQRADELVEVVGKAVVVIDQQDHIVTASSSARSEARALFRHSSYSFSGTESATMPAPLRTKTFPFFL